MTREQAIEIARKCAKARPQSYYAEPFAPHEWVIDAIMQAGERDAACTTMDSLDGKPKSFLSSNRRPESNVSIQRFRNKVTSRDGEFFDQLVEDPEGDWVAWSDVELHLSIRR